MVLLTVSVASALIAAGIAALQFLLPNALALVLSSALSDSHSAVTWSVVSRFLLSSDWPLFLRSDAASSHRTDRKVSVIAYTKPIGLIITAIAAVVTPLGLYEGVFPSTDPQIVTFVYVADTGPIANGTMPQSSLGFSRTCGYTDSLGASTAYCPQEPDLGNITYMWYNATYTYDNETKSSGYLIEYEPVNVQIRSPQIASPLVDLFQTGLDDQSTLTGFFDIAYREYALASRNFTVNNSSSVQPRFNMPSSYLLENKTILVEGLIADFANGGIGFRSHSVPVNLPYGAEWKEDILWWTPDVVCVNTNITLAMTTVNADQLASNGIIDRGGFVNLEKQNPFPVESDFYNTDAQKTPRLYDRAFYSAWGANAITMMLLNITRPNTNRSSIDSVMGKFFEVNSTKTFAPDVYSDGASQRQFPTVYMNLDGLVSAPFLANASYSDNPALANPYNITSADYDDHRRYCKQGGGGDPVSIARIDTVINMVAGPTYDKDGNPGTAWNTPGLVYERPTYVCAAATKMSIKTVTFRYNSTGKESLTDLTIVNITDKVYQHKDDLPLWGMEDLTANWNISMISPLWGFVNEASTSGKNVSSIRAEYFYVPAGELTANPEDLKPFTSGGSSYVFMNNVPAAEASARLWYSTFKSGTVSNAPDYSGKNDARYQNLWINMYRTTTGVANAYKLIWTDYATSYLTGTKGIHTARYKAPSTAPARRDTSVPAPGTYPVYVLQHRLRYKWIYGIPAILSIGLVGVVMLAALVSCIFGHASVGRLRHYLFSVTSGRVLASFVYPDSADDRLAPTRRWIDSVGYKPINVMGHGSVELTQQTSRDYVRIDQKGDSREF